MNGSKAIIRIIRLCLLLCLFPRLQAQEKEIWIDAAEEAISRSDNESITAEDCEDYQDLLAFPININQASMTQLESCGLFTTYQVNSILQYREEHGELLSLYELAALPGFSPAQLKEYFIYMTVNEIPPGTKPVKTDPGMVLFHIGKRQSNTDKQTDYPGPAWKTSLRIKKGLAKRLTMALAFEKDQGEKFLWESRPEHLCGYIEWKGRRRLEQLMFGNFRINNGMGLVQGAGIMHTPMHTHTRPLLLLKLKPYAGASESLIHQGVACKLNLGSVKLALWSSLQSLDLSLGNLALPVKDTDWTAHIRESGYHRTHTEQGGRSLAYLGSTGMQVLTALGRLNIGLQYSYEITGLTSRGRDSLQYQGSPSGFHTSSLQWQWRPGKLELYGEFSPGPRRSSAFIAGGRFHLNDFLSGTAQVHWYGASRRETFASAYASGSHIKNERGISLLIHAEPYRGIRADATAEIFHYPAPRAFLNTPSSGFRFSLTLQNGSQEALRWRLLMVNTSRPKNDPMEHAGIRALGSIQTLRIDGRIIYTPLPGFTWQSRLLISQSQGKPGGNSHAVLQQLGFRFMERIKCSAQLVLYQVPTWDNRIYLYEPGVYQQFSFPVYSGTGSKISLLTSLKLGRRAHFETRASLNRKDKTKSWETVMQLRFRF